MAKPLLRLSLCGRPNFRRHSLCRPPSSGAFNYRIGARPRARVPVLKTERGSLNSVEVMSCGVPLSGRRSVCQRGGCGPREAGETNLWIPPSARDRLFAVPDAGHGDLLRSALPNKGVHQGVHQNALLKRARSEAFDLIGRGEGICSVPAVLMRVRVR
jgi:hypothetical protein